MSRIAAIGVPLDGSDTALRSLGAAAWLGSRLGARVHLLHAGAVRGREETLARLRVPPKYHGLCEVHSMPGDPAEVILTAEARYGLGLLIMTSGGASADVQPPLEGVGRVARAVIERSRSPVVLLPPRYREALPWRSAVVPLSGEPGTDESLAAALPLAHALDLRVTVAHVVSATAPPGGAAVGSDEAHHELPSLLNELVERACPLCSAAERARIEDFRLYQGDVADKLEQLIAEKDPSLLVIGWHGRFMAGHARVLKALIETVSCPLLLIKPTPREPFRLKVGEAALDR
jgi:nucleotide-binding universal stress UspA family protein